MMIKNGLSVLLKSQKGFVERTVVVSAASASAAAAAAMGSRRFFNTGALMMKRDMFRGGADIPNLFRGRQTGGRCVGSSVPHQCNRRHMLPYFARALASSSASQSSGQSQRQEPEKKKKKECQIKTSSEFQRERCDEISSTEVSLNQFPGLMVDGNVKDSKTRRLLRLNPDTGYFEEEHDVSAAASNHHGHYELQVPHEHVCRGSAYGWLFLSYDNFYLKLLNPFSGAEIQLPPVTTLPYSSENEECWLLPSNWSVLKAVFSANPSIEPRPVVLIIYKRRFFKTGLAFCKPGDKGWTHLEFSITSLFTDAIYHKGQFYVLGFYGFVAAFDIGRCIDDDDNSVKSILIAAPSFRSICASVPFYERLQPELRNSYLVVLDGELFKFEFRSVGFHDVCIDKTKKLLERERNRDGDTSDEEDCTDEESDVVDDNDDRKKEWVVVDPRLCCVDPRARSCTYSIKIRRLDASEKQWVKVDSLGDKAVFLGCNTSFAISASDYPAGVCIPDSVYFIDGGGRFEFPVYDMGIYNVKDKRLKPLYPIPMDDAFKFHKPAPIWIVNSADS